MSEISTTKITELENALSVKNEDVFILTNTNSSKQLSYQIFKDALQTDLIKEPITRIVDNLIVTDLKITYLSTNVSANTLSINNIGTFVSDLSTLSNAISSNTKDILSIANTIGTEKIPETIKYDIKELKNSLAVAGDDKLGTIAIGFKKYDDTESIYYPLLLSSNKAYIQVNKGEETEPAGYKQLTGNVLVLSNKLSVLYTDGYRENILSIRTDIDILSATLARSELCSLSALENDVYGLSGNALCARVNKLHDKLSSVDADLCCLSVNVSNMFHFTTFDLKTKKALEVGSNIVQLDIKIEDYFLPISIGKVTYTGNNISIDNRYISISDSNTYAIFEIINSSSSKVSDYGLTALIVYLKIKNDAE